MPAPPFTAKNVFFNNFSSTQEQLLLESLLIEAHSIHAVQMFYIPRVLNNKDQVYTADDQSSYEQAILIPIYVENFDRFNGDGNFMAKFNLEIHNQIQLSVVIRTFNEEVGSLTSQVRPNEGDLIFYPQNMHCFQIKYVEKFEMFYPLGKLYVWQMTAELFDYSNEKFSTGIDYIDAMQLALSTDIFDFSILTEDGYMLTDEADNYIVIEAYDLDNVVPGSNEVFQQEADNFIVFSEKDPFSEGNFTDV